MKSPMFQETKELQYSFLENAVGRGMTRPHYHDGYEIYLQTEGVREIFFQHDKYLLKPGMLCVISPYVFHATRERNEGEPYSRYLINFSPKIFYEFLSEAETESILKKLQSCIMQLDEVKTSIIIGHIKNIDEYWHMFLDGIKRGKKLSHIEVYRMTDSIIRMMRDMPEILDLADMSRISDSSVYDVLLYIDGHYHESIGPENMMRLSHMSKSNFYRAFKRVTGDSFSHYLNRLRAAKAHELLLKSGLPLHEIAKKTGFSSTAHMSRIFKEIHGVSPSGYRRE